MEEVNPYAPPLTGPGGERQIRIVQTPPGEAPEAIRRAWVGLVLPLVKGRPKPRVVPTCGVLTGPRTWAGGLLRVLSGRAPRASGYIVDAGTAIRILGERSPEAAAWWRENTPHLLRPGRRFLFSAEVCREES